MSTLEATISMLETMPEDARLLVLQFTQKLFSSPRPANPYSSKSTDQILSDLELSRSQISNGHGLEMNEALSSLGEKYGFV